jgi:fatty-acid desaturase
MGTKITQIIKNTFSITHLWGGIVPMQVFGIWAIYNILTGTAPAWWWLAFIIGFVFMKLVGVGAGYHRLFSHHSFKVSRPMKLFVLWCGIISAQGSPFLWVGVHRGQHHRYSDTDKDPHSPEHGFWHSYILWMFTIEDKSVNLKSIIDLVRDPDLTFAHKHYSKILWLSHALVALISIDLWFYLMALPAFITLHVFCLQTSIVHYKWAGYRNYNTRDDSVNVPWLFPFSQGECWHNNHHGDPKNPNYGGRRWWEVDPTFWIIKLLKAE